MTTATITERPIVALHRLHDPPAEGEIIERRTREGVPMALYQPTHGPAEWRILQPKNPPEIEIDITRGEGPSYLCGKQHTITAEDRPACSIFPEPWRASAPIIAGGMMIRWGSSAPKTGGYDKCDVVLRWPDDPEQMSYAFRFDLQYGGTDAGETIGDSIRSRLRFYAGFAPTPAHMDEEQYTELVSGRGAELRDAARYILANLEV